jgi:branched-chain amino acid transport system substrate-binding protein
MTQKSKANDTVGDFVRKAAKIVFAVVVAVGFAIMTPPFAGSLNAADRDYVLIGRPETSTGPISGFGEPSPWADNRVLDFINKQGGVYIKEYGKKVPVKIKLMDNESSGTKAGEIASRLILHDKVDLMVLYQFSEAIASICERYEMPNLVVEHPVEPWQAGGPYKWSYQSGIAFKSAIGSWMAVWEEYIDRTNKTFGVLAPNDADGIAMAKNFRKMLEDKAWKVIDPGRYPSGLQDWTSVVKSLKDGKVQILTGSIASPDFAAAWRQINQQGAVPKICSVGRATLFPSGVNAIGGDLADGLVVDVHWSPQYPFKSALTGETCQQVADAWDKETGKQWTQVLGFKYAGMELAIDVLKRAQSVDKQKILQAIAETDLETLIGRIKYNKDHYFLTPIVTGQWVKGKKWPWEPVIINNKNFPEIPITAKMIFPLPGYRE